jgi:hypothetical protein
MGMGKNTEEDDLSAHRVIFTIYHLPDSRTKETAQMLITKGIMKALLSLLSEPGYRLNLTSILLFGLSTEPLMNV